MYSFVCGQRFIASLHQQNRFRLHTVLNSISRLQIVCESKHYCIKQIVFNKTIYMQIICMNNEIWSKWQLIFGGTERELIYSLLSANSRLNYSSFTIISIPIDNNLLTFIIYFYLYIFELYSIFNAMIIIYMRNLGRNRFSQN